MPSFPSTRRLINPFGLGIIADQYPHLQRSAASTAYIMESITKVQLFGSHNDNCGNMTNINNTTITLNKTDEDNRIKQWLSPLEPRYRHQSVQTGRVNGVGSWLLGKNEFRGWSGDQRVPKKAVLFCHGDPGVGKTYIRLVGRLSRTSGCH